MDRQPKEFTARAMSFQTLIAADRARHAIAFAENLLQDPDMAKRRERGLCKVCHYTKGVVAGQAVTEQPCASCKEPQVYGSTNTDALCLRCAHENFLCKHCGGDVDMNKRRTTWPEAKA